MAGVKKTKTALKEMRDSLARFLRYLPTLELKKQQLKVEIGRLEVAIEKKREEKRAVWEKLAAWVRLFAEGAGLKDLLRLETVRKNITNVAGVNVPIFEEAVFLRETVDPFATPPWIDDGLDVLEALIRLEAEESILREARHILLEEMRITSQRVNLFGKVKIPECRENIRVIKIALGDEQTAAVARAKIAEKRIVEREARSA